MTRPSDHGTTTPGNRGPIGFESSGGEVRLAIRAVSSPSMRTALPCFTGPVFTVRRTSHPGQQR